VTGTAQQDKRKIIAAGLAGLVLTAAVATLIVMRGGSEDTPGSSPRTAPEPSPSPTVAHAEWDISIFPAGRGKPNSRQQARAARQSDALSAAVESIYDSFLLTGDLSALEGSTLTRPAARSLGSSPLGLPKGFTEPVAVRREARVGVQTGAERRAAARVVYVVEGTRNGTTARLRHSSDLWLERHDGSWRAIAYTGERRGR
jgi:hypothetical protein